MSNTGGRPPRCLKGVKCLACHIASPVFTKTEKKKDGNFVFEKGMILFTYLLVHGACSNPDCLHTLQVIGAEQLYTRYNRELEKEDRTLREMWYTNLSVKYLAIKKMAESLKEIFELNNAPSVDSPTYENDVEMLRRLQKERDEAIALRDQERDLERRKEEALLIGICFHCKSSKHVISACPKLIQPSPARPCMRRSRSAHIASFSAVDWAPAFSAM